jgi:2-polyprenyl-3-methyl-5-hydroxy-6-metoxy-1,4-benzoquinol methylase
MQDKRQYWQEETKKFTWKHARILLIAEEINHNHDIQSVLDLGAGEALLFRLLDDRINYRGLDIAGEKGGAKSFPPVDFFDFDHLTDGEKVQDIPFDCVVISGLLEYLENWEELLEKVTKEWLKPGGMCFISFINSISYEHNALVKEHPQWRNKFQLRTILSDLDRLGLKVDIVFPIFWGSKSWLRPVIRLWASFANSRNSFISMDKSWVRQYLCLTHSAKTDEK